MDTHLNMIVGQTEQFSSWLAQGLSKAPKSSVMLTPSSQDGMSFCRYSSFRNFLCSVKFKISAEWSGPKFFIPTAQCDSVF